MISIIFNIFSIIISFYKSYFKRYQTIIVNDAHMLRFLNKYDFNKYLVSESVYSYGNLQASFDQYIIANIIKGSWFSNTDINVQPLNKSYFNDTKYNMHGYITHHCEYLTKYVNFTHLYTSYKGLIFHLDTLKSKLTFSEYFRKIRQDLYKQRKLIIRNYIKGGLVNDSLLKVKNMREKYQVTNNYFPGTIFILVGDLDYVYGLATVINKSVMFVDAHAIYSLNIGKKSNVLHDYIIVINNVGPLLDEEYFYCLLSLASHTENCVLVVRVRNYEEVKSTKLLNYITGYTVYECCD
jgi:hypothetical protein